MAILNIAPVTRQGMRFLISLYGLSDTGKTLSALKLAAGIEPDAAKRMMLDTEGGQRGRAYVDHIDGGYLYAHLSPPFTPERYIEAFDEIESAGVTTLVTDSISHSWFALGGVLDIVEASNDTNQMSRWKIPKRRLAKMTRRILSSDMHMILCSRGRQPMVETIGANGKKTYVLGPVMPIQEKSLRFDFTIMAHMTGDGHFDVSKPAGKCPGILRPVFAANEVMDEQMGRKLIAWLGEQKTKTPEQRDVELRATEAAEAGTEAFRLFWKGLAPEFRDHLKPHVGNYGSIAKAADEDAERAKHEAQDAAVDVEDPFGSAGAAVDQTDWLAIANDLITRVAGARHQEELALMIKETAFACLSNGAMPVEMADKVRDHIEDMRGSLPASAA